MKQLISSIEALDQRVSVMLCNCNLPIERVKYHNLLSHEDRATKIEINV